MPNAPDRGHLHPEIFIGLAPEMKDGAVGVIGVLKFEHLGTQEAARSSYYVLAMVTTTRELKFKYDNCPSCCGHEYRKIKNTSPVLLIT